MKKIDLSQYSTKQDGTSSLSAAEWNAIMVGLQKSINSAPELNTLTINGTKATVDDDGTVTISQPGNYVLSGTLYGRVIVDVSGQVADSFDNTHILLQGVTIINDGTHKYTDSNNYCLLYKTPIENVGYKGMVITLERDSINNFICYNIAEVTDDQPGAIWSQNNLTLQGVGYLTCINNGGHGVRATDLELVGINLYAEASHDGVHAGNINIEDGNYYINKAKDAFGSSKLGTVNIYGGKFYAYNILENIFDGKAGNNLYATVNITSDTAAIYSGTAPVSLFDTPVGKYGNKGTVVQYETIVKNDDSTWTGAGTPLTPDAEGKYQVTQQYVEVKGYIANPIIVSAAVEDVDFRLDNCYIVNNTVAATPTIYYMNDGGRLKLFSAVGTTNYILNNIVGDETVDLDAVKSENNISVEVKKDSHLIIYSKSADGIDSGTVKITDSKGILHVNNCGGRGIKGSVVLIGPNAEVKSSVITSYHTDPLDTDNYSTMEGAVICKNNCKLFSESIGVKEADDSANYKKYGYSDIYCRNGKLTKGVFGTTPNELKGVIICDSLAAVINIDFGKSQNVYFNRNISPLVPVVNKIKTTRNDYVSIPFNYAPILK